MPLKTPEQILEEVNSRHIESYIDIFHEEIFEAIEEGKCSTEVVSKIPNWNTKLANKMITMLEFAGYSAKLTSRSKGYFTFDVSWPKEIVQ